MKTLMPSDAESARISFTARLGGTLSARVGLALLAALLTLGRSAHAQSSYTWNGGSGSTGNWNDGANWGGSGPANPQAFLNFNGATRTSSTNNFAGGSAGYQIYFKNGASAFTLYGNSIFFYDFGGGANDPNIQNEGTSPTQTINLPVANGNNNGTFHVLNVNVNTGTSQGPLTFNGTVSSADAGQALRVVNLYGPSALTFNGIVSDFDSTHKLALSQLGSGTTTLTASNTFTGDMTVNAGTLVLATNSALANSGNFIRLGDTAGTTGANLNLNGGNNLSTSINVRSGSSGTKTIANTSGTAGTATFGGNLFLDANATLFANTGGGNALTSSTLDLKNQTLTVDGTGSNVISGVLQQSTGSGKLVKNGTGALTLSGASTYTGGTTIKAGTVIISGGSSTIASGQLGPSNSVVFLGDTTGTASATLTHSGSAAVHYYPITVQAGSSGTKFLADVSSASVNYKSNIVLNDSVTLDPGSTGNVILTGPITGGGGLNKVSSGTAQLNAVSSANTYSGNTTISQGTFQLGSATAIPNGSGKGTVVLNPTSPNTATFDLSGNNQTINGLSSSGTGSALVDNLSSLSRTLTVGTTTSSPDGTFSGVIQNSSSGTLGLTKDGTGTLTLSGNNTYSGATTISAGTVKLGAAGVIPDGTGKGNVSVSGTLDLNTFSETINGLSGAGTVDSVAGGSPTLTVGGNDQSGTFSGIIKNTAGTLALTKTGTGTFTLSGTNTYAGSTTVSAGSLALSGSGSISNSPNITVSSAAGFDVSGRTGGSYTLAGGQTLKGNGGVKGTVVVSSGATVAPGTSIGTLYLTNAPVLNGTTLMEINRTNTPTADLLVLTSGTLNYGGTLTVTNIGSALQGGDTFTLFSAPATNGVFAATNLPALSAGQNWWTTNNYVSLIVNQVTAGSVTNTRTKGLGLKMKISELLTNVASLPAGGDTFALTAVGASTNGATITTNGTYIFFTPGTGSSSNSNESFTYTVADARGGSATGLITINVLSAVGGPQTITVSGSTATVNFAGIPGYAYAVQRSTNLVSWVTLFTTNAPTAGLFNFTDDFSDLGGPPASAYYRTAQP